jgi:hypothetical protein
MSDDFELIRDGWLGSADDAEARTITRLRVSIGGDLITRNVSKRGGGETEAINTSLLPLAEFLAKNWWPLLYEPVRPNITDAFRVRHRLDSGMRGYAFPPLALWSGGERTIVADWASFKNPFATISFLATRPEEPIQLNRDHAEISLMDLIESVVERAGSGAVELLTAWDQVKHSISDPNELAYCSAAGRLGLDPYDPDSPDLSAWADGIPETLFSDVSEIAEIDALPQTTAWLRENEATLKIFPETDLSYFGKPAADDLNNPGWQAGQDSAELLRANAGVQTENPRKAISDLLGGVISEAGVLQQLGPEGLSAIVQRLGSSARLGIIARSSRQRRFRACAAVYMAWTATDGEDRAATDAFTRRQQASRAFAAEMVAPRQALLARDTKNGFDGEDLENLAKDFICPYETVKWQALRAGIKLRGVDLPLASRPTIVTEAVSPIMPT